jgi:hypothetical protein
VWKISSAATLVGDENEEEEEDDPIELEEKYTAEWRKMRAKPAQNFK